MLPRRFAAILVALGSVVAACAGETEEPSDDSSREESNLTTAEATRICNAIPAPKAWTREEADKLITESVRRFADLKRSNDALIARRGVGGFAGAKSAVW